MLTGFESHLYFYWFIYFLVKLKSYLWQILLMPYSVRHRPISEFIRSCSGLSPYACASPVWRFSSQPVNEPPPKWQGFDAPGAMFNGWKARVGGQIHQPLPSLCKTMLRCVLLTSSGGLLWYRTPIAHSSNPLINTPIFGFLSSLPHCPTSLHVFPEVTSQIHSLNPKPCMGVHFQWKPN